MENQPPIIIVEDDKDDQDILTSVFNELNIEYPVKFFEDGIKALTYLMTTAEHPFLIMSDINIPKMSGTEFRQAINENTYLRKKAIPFVFFTTSADKEVVEDAYKIMVQGFFVKPGRMARVKEMVKTIIDYWRLCRHPYSL